MGSGAPKIAITASPWNLSIVPPWAGHDLGHRGQVLADDGGDVARRQALGQRREPADVGEQDRDLELLRLDRGLRMGGEPVGDLLRHERRERLLRRGLLDDGRMQPLELVDQAGARRPPPAIRRNSSVTWRSTASWVVPSVAAISA